MTSDSLIEVVQEAVDKTGMNDVRVADRTKLLSDNGSGYVSLAFVGPLKLVCIRNTRIGVRGLCYISTNPISMDYVGEGLPYCLQGNLQIGSHGHRIAGRRMRPPVIYSPLTKVVSALFLHGGQEPNEPVIHCEYFQS